MSEDLLYFSIEHFKWESDFTVVINYPPARVFNFVPLIISSILHWRKKGNLCVLERASK
jgi:hypothetical protein